MKSRNLNAAQFADEIGVQRSSVSHILTGRNNASLDFMLKVMQRFPEIDTDWLLTGKGIMMRTPDRKVVATDVPVKKEQVLPQSILQVKESTGDLFRQPIESISYETSDIEKTIESVSFSTNQTNRVLVEKEAQKKPDEVVNKTNSTRYVEKIVIFYSDKSFADYKPEN